MLFWFYRKGKWKRKYKQLRKDIKFDPKQIQSQLINAYTNNNQKQKSAIYTLLKKSNHDISTLKQTLDKTEIAHKVTSLNQMKRPQPK